MEEVKGMLQIQMSRICEECFKKAEMKRWTQNANN
jgi:hypothetical protein